ncbi:hypothetical protein EON65_34735 [archaeon]|nr:MAG: hypothetical protein EON65_34735 [archaeon]
MWFCAMSVDIHVSLTNPFSSPQVYDFYYRLGVYGFAAFMATILVAMTPIQYGVSTDPMIWVRDQSGKINWTKIGMFYMFIPFIYAYGMTILIWARWQIHRGLEDTLKARKYSVNKQSRCKFTPILIPTPTLFHPLSNQHVSTIQSLLCFMKTVYVNIFSVIFLLIIYPIDVIGYFCFYAVLYSFQFVTYLKEDFNAYHISKVSCRIIL